MHGDKQTQASLFNFPDSGSDYWVQQAIARMKQVFLNLFQPVPWQRAACTRCSTLSRIKIMLLRNNTQQDLWFLWAHIYMVGSQKLKCEIAQAFCRTRSWIKWTPIWKSVTTFESFCCSKKTVYSFDLKLVESGVGLKELSLSIFVHQVWYEACINCKHGLYCPVQQNQKCNHISWK